LFNLTFHGAAREVTGSLHLVEADGRLIALDCGMFQGRRRETEGKNRVFPFDPTKLHAVVLSHAHLDHCGRLPLLAAGGFTGRVFSTPATRDLAGLMLRDSAHIQEEDAAYLNEKLERKGRPPVTPLYREQDAVDALKLFQSAPPERSIQLTDRLSARFLEAGHMLGSAMIQLDYAGEHAKHTTLLFSGDVGRFTMPLLRDPAMFPACDYLICESTYGGRRHPPGEDLKQQLADVVNDTIQRGGKIIVPAFSVGRTQVIVYFLHQLLLEHKIPVIPIFVDSPLAVNATEVFRLHPDLFDQEAREFIRRGLNIFGCESCTYIRDVEESKALHHRHGPMIIISASGMCEAGRVLHHLKNNVESPKNTVLIVGFQAEHTLGRRIVEKQPHLKIFGREYKLKAKVVVLNGFSAHADRDELARLYQPMAAGCRRAFLVHGEPDQMVAMQEQMRASGFAAVDMPEAGTTYDLGRNAVSVKSVDV